MTGHSIASAVSAPLVGGISDRLGRKITLIAVIVLHCATTYGSALCVHFDSVIGYLVLRLLSGIGTFRIAWMYGYQTHLVGTIHHGSQNFVLSGFQVHQGHL
jgi:MFS family permease